MKASRIYTAQEMREAADFFMRNSESVRQKVRSNSVLANIHESTAMLLQAAKMREALEETQSAIEKCMEILNRIPDGVEYDGLIDEVADELCDLRDSHVKPALSTSQRFQGKLLPRKIACNRCRTSR